MTRRKKSRKPGPLAPAKQPRDEKAIDNAVKGKKKGKGKKPGQRHTVDKPQSPGRSSVKSQSDDPRKGSQKKVKLVSAVAISSASQVDETPLTAEQELTQLEQDVKLQQLLERFENGDELSASEQRYVDEKSERYEQLAAQLGIDLDDWDDEEY